MIKTINPMTKEETPNFYRTDNLSLAPYLAMNDLQYCSGEMSDDGKIFFIFKDPKKIGHELAISFERSSERTYKNLWQTFRSEIDNIKSKTIQAYKRKK